MYFSGKSGGAVFLDDDVVWKYTDEELKEILSGPVFLSAKAAIDLEKRGFSEYTGVSVRKWEGKTAGKEIMYITGQGTYPQMGLHELVPINDSVKWDSKVIHLKNAIDKIEFEEDEEVLFPGSTIYKNSLGGTVFAFSGTPHTNFQYAQAFSFLTESRKAQIVNMLKSVDCLPVYYPGDIDVYMRAGFLPDNSIMCAMFNISLDPLEEITLVLEKKATKIKKLNPDGSYSECKFYEKDGVTYIENESLNILDPKVFIIS